MQHLVVVKAGFAFLEAQVPKANHARSIANEQLAVLDRVDADVRDGARMVLLPWIDALVPVDDVSGKLERVQVHDEDVAPLRAQIDPLVLELDGHDGQPLLVELQGLQELGILLRKVPEVDGVVGGGGEELARVAEEEHLHNSCFGLVAELGVDPRLAEDTDASIPGKMKKNVFSK